MGSCCVLPRLEPFRTYQLIRRTATIPTCPRGIVVNDVTRGEDTMKIDGRCHCGYVSFEAEADPETTTICNCTDCQTMSGAPLRAVIMTQPGTFVLLSGQPTEYRKTADSGAIRVLGFCPRCGSAIYSTSDGDDATVYNVRVGVVRQRYELVPRKQVFARSQQAWVNNLNSIPKFEKMPPP